MTNPAVRKLPAWILPAALTTPPVLTLPLSMLPDTLNAVPVRLATLNVPVRLMLLALTLPNKLMPSVVNVATGVILDTLTVTLPLAATLTFELPLMIWLPAPTVILLSNPPSPKKYPPVSAVIFPVTLTVPPV